MPTQPNDDAPLIVTARVDSASFAILDGLRRRHFPAALNKVPAHISLFHHLPGSAVDRVVADAARACAEHQAFDLCPVNVRLLGRGVAFAYASQELDRLHKMLARAWAPWLTPQDRQPFKAHITIQNKVDPKVARHLHESLICAPIPGCRVEGVDIWRYHGGPWESVTSCLFADHAQQPS